MARAAGLISALTFASRILGLVRDFLFAVLIGAGEAADAFVVAFRIPNLLRDLFAEGALSAAFVPVFSDYLKNRPREDAFRLGNRVAGALAVIVGALVIAGIVFADPIVRAMAPGFSPDKQALTVLLTRIMMPFLLFVSLAALAMGMLTAQGRFGAPAAAPSLFNLASIAVGVGLYAGGAGLEASVVGWSIGTLAGGAAQLLVQLPALDRTGWRPAATASFRDEGVRRIAGLFAPATVGLAATQVNILVATIFASLQAGAVAWLQFAFRLMQLPLGVFGVAVATVSTAGLSERAAAGDMDGLRKTLSQALRLVAFLTLPAAAGLIALAEPVIRLIYQWGRFTAADAHATAMALVAYAAGLYAYSSVKVLAPAFYALGRPRIAVMGSLAAVGANLALNVAAWALLPTDRLYVALALGTAAAATVNHLVLTSSFERVVGGLRTAENASALARTALAAAVMGAAVFALGRMLAAQLGTAGIAARLGGTLVPVAAGALLYVAACRLLRVQELELFVAAIRRRVRK
jgi:putative peptidoglycan lipid II flippase